MAGSQAVVALTDERWFSFLASRAVHGSFDEVNFWRPLAQSEFHALEPGGPFFFRLKHPVNAVAGFGFFAHATRLPVALARDAFGEGNGDPSYDGFVARIAEYRRETPAEVVLGDRDLTCIILRGVQLLPQSSWLPWAADEGWRKNVVALKSYDLESDAGRLLADLLHNGVPADLSAAYELVDADSRRQVGRDVTLREGAGAFRVRVLDAYGRRCAVTGEHSLMAEFHANAGKVGGRFESRDVLILTTTGARTGQTRWNPVVYSKDGDRFVIAVSKGGGPSSPDWYHNLVANPSAVIEVGDDVISVKASIATGAERDRLYAQHAANIPQFLEYAKNTIRTIPLVVLTRGG